ncbi:MAG: hypothetical protein AABY22_18780 [Nanoarchaeota archaeon]
MDIEKLKKLYENSTFSENDNFDWEDLEVKEDYVYVPQGSHLGETLIVFDDNYEGSGEDALFISELLKEFIKEVKK